MSFVFVLCHLCSYCMICVRIVSFSVRIVTFSCGIASFSVQLELCHLVFGSNCFI